VRPLDWAVLAASLLFIVLFGLWKGRRQKDLDGYILADRDMRWYTVALSIMATQASAITFLSTPGQAYTDGMRFVQFYFGLPLAMIVLCITAVPIFHRLKVYTAYEYLERRFDVRVRTLAGGLFLIQRGLACGLTIYAPAVILSVLLGWNLYVTNIVIGALVVAYTATGGTRAVNHTNTWQMAIIFLGMFSVLAVTLLKLPPGVTLGDAVWVAGHMGKLNAIDWSFDWNNRYNIWSGLIGGFFLALSYFGTDQSQVGRYLSGQSITQSRLGLLTNGLVKVPMQFAILFVGAMVFVFHLFSTPPVYFNSVAVDGVRASALAPQFAAHEAEWNAAVAERREGLGTLLAARRTGDAGAEAAAEAAVAAADEKAQAARAGAVEVVKQHDPKSNGRDVNYIFLSFVLAHLPVGLVGLVLATVFAASMSSTASELNALSSTTVVDVYRRLFKREASEKHLVAVSKLSVVIWGAVAVTFAEFANKLGSLVEAVNILGSLFYGTILGIFLVAFYMKRVGGNATFLGALVGQAVVVYFFTSTKISFLWYNVIGCLVTMAAAGLLQLVLRKPPAGGGAAARSVAAGD
jgi:SSS family solute:Na+ symporter